MELNPIVVKEVRSRWRGRAFILLTAYVLLLAGTVLFTYQTSGYNMTRQDWENNAPRYGHDLFEAFSYMQVLGWLLIGPALTATSISGERETGLLEGLQMSPLRPGRIVWGKLSAVLLFIALMQLTALPITSTCFLMGGTSGGEFTRAFALEFATAACCAATGIYFSSVLRRSQAAITVTFCVLLGWVISSAFGLILGVGPPALASGYPAPFNKLIPELALWFGLTNPVMAMAAIVDPRSYPAFAGPTASLLFRDPVTVCIGFQAAVALILMPLAARAVRKPLPDPQVAPRRTRRAGRGSARTSEPTYEYLTEYVHLPAVANWRSTNPVLQRELRAKFRWKRLPTWVSCILVLAGAGITWWYIYEIGEIANGDHGPTGVWAFFSIIGTIANMIAVALMGAAGFAREREAKTWEALELSQLTPGEIIKAKLEAILTGCILYSMPVWPLLLFSLASQNAAHSGRDTMSIDRAIMVVASMLATLWWVTAYSLYLSWFFKRTAAAIGWALGSLTFAMVFVPIILVMLLSGSPGSGLEDILTATHPLVQVVAMLDQSEFDRSGGAAALGIVVSFIAGWVWIGLLHTSMNRQPITTVAEIS